MKSYESTLALSSSRRSGRLSSLACQRSISLVFFTLSIFFLLSSVAVAQKQQQQQQQQQQQKRNPWPSAAQTLANGSVNSFSTVRRRQTSTSASTSTSTSTSLILVTTSTSRTNNTTIEMNRSSAKTAANTAVIIIVIVVCSLMTIATIVGNLVVILAVCLVRKLQTASNILIVSLAVSDILVGLFIMPLALVLQISEGEWLLGSVMCDIWTSTDVLLCTSSILNFLIISIDRYCIINHPFRYAPMRKVKLLSLMIAAVWILSALVSLPPILGWGRPSDNLPTCEVNNKLEYQIFATMLSFYIPLIVVLIIYANIYRTAQTAVDNRSSVQMSQFLNQNPSSSTTNAQLNTVLAQQQVNGNSCSTPQLLSNAENHHDDVVGDGSGLTSAFEQRLSGGRRSLKKSPDHRSRSFLSPSRCLGRRISTPFNGRLSIFVTRRYSFFRHVHLPNQKAIRTLGVILGTFIVCWLPFMLYALIKPLHQRITSLTGTPKSLNAPEWLDPVLLWFGYSSSMLNPLIYSKFNREFRTPFRDIMCCRCRGLNEKIRRQDYLENLYGDQYLSAPHLQSNQQPTAGPGQARISATLGAAV